MREVTRDIDGVRVTLAGLVLSKHEIAARHLFDVGSLLTRCDAIREFERVCGFLRRNGSRSTRAAWYLRGYHAAQECLQMTEDFDSEQLAAIRDEADHYRNELQLAGGAV